MLRNVRIGPKVFGLSVVLIGLMVLLSVFNSVRSERVRRDLDVLTAVCQPLAEELALIDMDAARRRLAFAAARSRRHRPPCRGGAQLAPLQCPAGFAPCQRARARHRSACTGHGGGQRADLCIGIATGEMVVGNIGSERAMSWTVVGRTVNLAARLEKLDRAHGTRILVPRRTHDLAAAQVRFRSIGDVAIKGVTGAIAVYEVLGTASGDPHLHRSDRRP